MIRELPDATAQPSLPVAAAPPTSTQPPAQNPATPPSRSTSPARFEPLRRPLQGAAHRERGARRQAPARHRSVASSQPERRPRGRRRRGPRRPPPEAREATPRQGRREAKRKIQDAERERRLPRRRRRLAADAPRGVRARRPPMHVRLRRRRALPERGFLEIDHHRPRAQGGPSVPTTSASCAARTTSTPRRRRSERSMSSARSNAVAKRRASVPHATHVRRGPSRTRHVRRRLGTHRNRRSRRSPSPAVASFTWASASSTFAAPSNRSASAIPTTPRRGDPRARSAGHPHVMAAASGARPSSKQAFTFPVRVPAPNTVPGGAQVKRFGAD